MHSQQRPTTWSMGVGIQQQVLSYNKIQIPCSEHMTEKKSVLQRNWAKCHVLPHREKNKILNRTKRRAHAQAKIKSLSRPLTVVVKLDEQGNWRRKILRSLESSLGPVCSVTCSQGEEDAELNYHIQRVITKIKSHKTEHTWRLNGDRSQEADRWGNTQSGKHRVLFQTQQGTDRLHHTQKQTKAWDW